MSFLLEVQIHSTQLEETLGTLAMMPFEIDPSIRNLPNEKAVVEFSVMQAEHAGKVQNALNARGLRDVRVVLQEPILA